jgi:hypothetical protein
VNAINGWTRNYKGHDFKATKIEVKQSEGKQGVA